MRARELHQRDQRLVPLWISCLVAAVLAGVSTPYLWNAFAWLGRVTEMPTLVWQAGFALYWFAPAVLIAVILAMRDKHRPELLSKADLAVRRQTR